MTTTKKTGGKAKATTKAKAKATTKTADAKPATAPFLARKRVIKGEATEAAASERQQSATKQPVAKQPTARPAGKTKTAGAKRLSLLDAAAQVLAESAAPMSTAEMVAKVEADGLWTRGAGKTPQATLYSAILREVRDKGAEARFTKTDRGRFAAASNAEPAAPTTAKAPKGKGAKGKAPAKPQPQEATTVIPDGAPGPDTVAELLKI